MFCCRLSIHIPHGIGVEARLCKLVWSTCDGDCGRNDCGRIVEGTQVCRWHQQHFKVSWTKSCKGLASLRELTLMTLPSIVRHGVNIWSMWRKYRRGCEQQDWQLIQRSAKLAWLRWFTWGTRLGEDKQSQKCRKLQLWKITLSQGKKNRHQIISRAGWILLEVHSPPRKCCSIIIGLDEKESKDFWMDSRMWQSVCPTERITVWISCV